MNPSRRLQIRLLLLCVKLIGGIHLKEEYRAAIDDIIADLKNCKD